MIWVKDPQQINIIGKRRANGATMFFIIEKSEETTFTKFCRNHINNGNTKDCKFVKWFWQWKFKICNKKWYVIDSESNGNYSEDEEIKFLTRSIESSLCDYSDAYILVTGSITVTRTIAGDPVQKKQPLDAATQVVFKSRAPFKKCSTEIDGILVDEADFINIIMPIYNLIEYSDNYSGTSGSLWGFKRDGINKKCRSD